MATDVIMSLGEKLFSAAVKEILFAADTESHIKSLENTKAMIDAVLLDADASTQEGQSRVQRLELEKLSRVLDKIDDLLDEKATRSELKKLAAPSGFKDQLTKPKPRALLDLETGSHTISEEIIGRDRDRDNIIRRLFDSSSSFSVIAIVGIGGMGKTTLAQYVYNDEREEKYFDQRLWVYATRGNEDSWLLFQRATFPHEGKGDQSLENIGQQILEKCPKIPLVILTIGGLLRGEEATEDKWQAFRDGLLHNLRSAVPDVMESLKLSYNQLDSRLKLCFAYCSLFPRGWEFNKDELICRWIASGYAEERYRTQSLEDAGEEYVLSLMNHGFFQNAKKDEFGCITTFRIHDMMYGLAVLVASSKYKMLDSDCVEIDHELEKRDGHVSFSEKAENLPPLLLEHRENLRSLLPLRFCYSFGELQLRGLSRFQHSRVLRLRRSVVKEVPTSIGKLIHLRYLDLSWNFSICELPHSITKLVNLLSLDLNNCSHLVELPERHKQASEAKAP
ncbi:hypothetical protein Cgig2_021220 [Carnegiea gigantea]|uniref:Uncharacterized protein n=1 Tax=Carnegiea gigantea TaxID=171969 RepID=A0A9Q1QPT2_9CARY|nr:hypothetical protein Cgig2_021220 [Carnegiea gigantea]